MAVYESKQTPFLSFYVNGKRKRFSNGSYETTNKAEKDVLDALKGVTCVEADKPASKPKPASKSEKPAEESTKKADGASDN
ncbi:hypothetical protein D7Z54_33045 [Salibacterium salarium]|uniref:Uncharacterized protein n=1 Tax=Salibacterium salarium TaxID=284579 RepID=A0A3R9PXE0_9BACI|nr:hypothetical protein [Salibacterium salarium]RSL29092.1 hypothetical protein D7Z54_33045 [Salibacterium salarium]